MTSYILREEVSDENFDEEAYLSANNDVALAVNRGEIDSGRRHFDIFGRKEKRVQWDVSKISEAKKLKLVRLEQLLRTDMPCKKTPRYYDFLTADLKQQFNIIDTSAVSANGYDAYAMELIEKHSDGWILDCGAGKRPVYFDNVVNFEIADYDTTDVRGVGEVLPFLSNMFDAVISIAVLEHVKDPFVCAKEICRVLKPGGDIMCCVAFLQPVHGYPHHYYNMTHSGLQNLFEAFIEIEKIDCYYSVLPIWTLTWLIRSWSEGLSGRALDDFLSLKMADLLKPANHFLDKNFVTQLSKEKNLELASATVLFGRKRI